ncbi:MAG: hypothetical protein COA79_04530 [Planctomycetota bacterium]|nr:MAG: hypothetical protein COA79_04530 [Planctomycetota bacterium]
MMGKMIMRWMTLSFLFFIITGLISSNIQGQNIPLNEFELKVYIPDNIDETSVNPEDIAFVSFDSLEILEVAGNDKVYFKIEGGSGDFVWESTEMFGLLEKSLPIGVDDEGNLNRFAVYQVPDEFALLDIEIIVSVTDSNMNLKALTMKMVTFDRLHFEQELFIVKAETLGSLTSYHQSFTLTVENGAEIKFMLTSGFNNNFKVISEGTSSLFGEIKIDPSDNSKMTYVASNSTGALSGVDKIIFSDEINTIHATILIGNATMPSSSGCVPDGDLRIGPNSEGRIKVDPGEKIKFVAQGGTCSFTWRLTTNNSGSVIKIINLNAVSFIAGNESGQVDVLEVSDGLNSKRIEIQVGEIQKANNLSCFISKKSQIRD